MTHPELRYVRHPTQHETVHECAPEVWAESLYDCGPGTWFRAPLSVRFPVRAADRVHVSASAALRRPQRRRSVVRQGYFPPALVSPVAVAAGSTVASDLAPRSRPGTVMRPLSPAWGWLNRHRTDRPVVSLTGAGVTVVTFGA